LKLFKIDKQYDLSNNNKFSLIFMGDMHVGSPNCDYKLVEEHVEEIRQIPNAMVFLMGDLAEWIIMGDKRFYPSQIDKRFRSHMEQLPMTYSRYLKDLLLPIADKIEVVHDGNHEKKLVSSMYPGAELCGNLRAELERTLGPEALTKLRYAPGEAYTKITWKMGVGDTRTLMINTAHGWQAGRKPGAKHNELSYMFSWIGADIIMRGHSHELFAVPGPIREVPNPQMTKLKEIQTITGHTGSYLKTRELEVDEIDRPCYSEYGGFRPTPLGHVQIDVTLTRRGMKKEIIIKQK